MWSRHSVSTESFRQRKVNKKKKETWLTSVVICKQALAHGQEGWTPSTIGTCPTNISWTTSVMMTCLSTRQSLTQHELPANQPETLGEVGEEGEDRGRVSSHPETDRSWPTLFSIAGANLESSGADLESSVVTDGNHHSSLDSQSAKVRAKKCTMTSSLQEVACESSCIICVSHMCIKTKLPCEKKNKNSPLKCWRQLQFLDEMKKNGKIGLPSKWNAVSTVYHNEHFVVFTPSELWIL